MYILGFCCYGKHDAAVALLKDGQVVAAVEEERFDRKKFSSAFPHSAMRWALDQEGISFADVDHVGYFWKPYQGLLRRSLLMLRYPGTLNRYRGGKQDRIANRQASRWLKIRSVEKELRQSYDFRGRFHFVDHHMCHAASAYFVSPFDDAAVLTVDGSGEWACTRLYHGTGNQLSMRQEIGYPHSLGMFYGTFTQFLGFQFNSDEYRVMGLAPYGQPRYLEEVSQLVELLPGGRYRLQLPFFDFYRQTGTGRWYNDRLVELLGPARGEDDPIEQRHMDLAASVQAFFEKAMLHLASHAREATGSKNLALCGGCALNSVANGKLAASGLFDKVYVQPASHDAGTALGAALWIHHGILGKSRNHVMDAAYLGPAFEGDAIAQALDEAGVDYRASDDVAADTAQLVAEGNVVGWFQGRMEFGPRALGSRSILADPRRAEMKDVVNKKIKFREEFRPFAPSVLEERCAEWFEWSGQAPFMLFVCPVVPDKRERIPAVTHVDGSARIQTVSARANPVYHRMISHFEEATGVPVVLNTSFNIKGEPIVNTPAEAIRCFLRTDMDNLVIGDYVASKATVATASADAEASEVREPSSP